MKNVKVRARRGDLSGPILALLVIIVLLTVGIVVVTYLLPFASEPRTPVAMVQGTPIAYRYMDNTRFEITIRNLGNFPLKIETGPGPAERRVNLIIVYPEDYSGIVIYPDQTYPSTIVIYPGGSAVLTFTSAELPWSVVSKYDTVRGILKIIDSKGDVVSMSEVKIRVIRGKD